MRSLLGLRSVLAAALMAASTPLHELSGSMPDLRMPRVERPPEDYRPPRRSKRPRQGYERTSRHNPAGSKLARGAGLGGRVRGF